MRFERSRLLAVSFLQGIIITRRVSEGHMREDLKSVVTSSLTYVSGCDRTKKRNFKTRERGPYEGRTQERCNWVPYLRFGFSLIGRRNFKTHAYDLDTSVNMVISGRALNRTRIRCPKPRLMYMRRPLLSGISPLVYLRLRTGTIGGGRNGGLHCPPWVCPESIHPWNGSQSGRSAPSGL